MSENWQSGGSMSKLKRKQRYLLSLQVLGCTHRIIICTKCNLLFCGVVFVYISLLFVVVAVFFP